MQSNYTGETGRAYFERFQSEFLSADIGRRKAAKLNAFLQPSWSIVDFGCSAGQITALLAVREKVGVEINETAAKFAHETHKLRVVASLSELADGVYDAVVTHHVLEHVTDPVSVLAQFRRVLKPGGRAVIVVPAEAAWYRRHNHWRDEINKHLYSWTPLSLGNLCTAVGLNVETAMPATYTEPSRFLGPLNRLPYSGRLMGLLRQVLKGESEIVVVASKPPR